MLPMEDMWTFDVSGFLHVPTALTAAEVAAAAAELLQGRLGAASLPLRAHTAVVARVPEFGCGQILATPT